MDKKTLYEKAEKAFNQAFQAAKESARVVSEKAGEAAHLTRLLIEKVGLEHQVAKQFAKIGSRVYEKAKADSGNGFGKDPDIKDLIESTRKLEDKLADVEKLIESQKKSKAPKPGQ